MAAPFLLFQLYGPMISWGEVAVGEERDSSSVPTRSAVLGLCAAALGIERTEDQALRDLNQSLGFGFCVEAHGDLLRDYHTVQSPTGKKARDLPTRRDELAYDNIEATLSKRHYRTDAAYVIALWEKQGPKSAPIGLAELADALRKPRFTLFLGRKSCPLGLPLNPTLIEADTLLQAFQRFPFDADVLRHLRNRFDNDTERAFYWDASTGVISSGMEGFHISKRWDELVSRSAWQFARRDEAYARAPWYRKEG